MERQWQRSNYETCGQHSAERELTTCVDFQSRKWRIGKGTTDCTSLRENPILVLHKVTNSMLSAQLWMSDPDIYERIASRELLVLMEQPGVTKSLNSAITQTPARSNSNNNVIVNAGCIWDIQARIGDFVIGGMRYVWKFSVRWSRNSYYQKVWGNHKSWISAMIDALIEAVYLKLTWKCKDTVNQKPIVALSLNADLYCTICEEKWFAESKSSLYMHGSYQRGYFCSEFYGLWNAIYAFDN